MFDFAPPDPEPDDRPSQWTAERFVAALHPADSRGAVSLLFAAGETMRTCTYRPADLSVIAGPASDHGDGVYIAMNRYHGPRGGGRPLAGLNALWLDLDIYNMPALTGLPRQEVVARIAEAVARANLPAPSFLVDSGRGFYCIWLLAGIVPAAITRWSAVQRTLVEWGAPLGADPKCVDAPRVLRLPGSWHHEADRQVHVVAGTGERHVFDALADRICRATGRPVRADLEARKLRKRRSAPASSSGSRPACPRGLSRIAFHRQVLGDLETLQRHWGGRIPAGLRTQWLHLWTTAMTWVSNDPDLAESVVAMAAAAAPGLSETEVRRTMRTTLKRGDLARMGQRGSDGRDPRYDYCGARLAELLNVDRQISEALGLSQIIPRCLRKDRARSRRVERRRAEGIMSRQDWLAKNSLSRNRPWEAEGISRATWYRRQADLRERRRRARFKILLASASLPAAVRETGPVSLYGGVAQPGTLAYPANKPIQYPKPRKPQDRRDPKKIQPFPQMLPRSIRRTNFGQAFHLEAIA